MAAQCANKVAVGHRKIYNYRLNNTNSGLTHYNLKMGTNAMENIRYIGETRIHNLRTRLFGVLVHSELGPRTKAHMLVQGLFPVWWAKRDLRNNQAALENDKME